MHAVRKVEQGWCKAHKSNKHAAAGGNLQNAFSSELQGTIAMKAVMWHACTGHAAR
jgi:hypothetical protein